VIVKGFNPLNTKLNPICHLLALLGAHPVLYISRIRVKMCCISSVMVGTDNDMLWNSSEVDGNIRSECEENKGTNCEDEESDTDW
jgi:hypothetical protein